MPNHSTMDTTCQLEVKKSAPSKRTLTNSTEAPNSRSGNTSSRSDSKISSAISATMSVNSSSELASLFECPVCFEYVLPPITQCQNGHLVCQSCRAMITSCPTCRVQITNNIRNLQMEKLATTVHFPCKYSSHGCPNHMLYKEKNEHEETCNFKPYNCPCPGSSCKWTGSLDQIMTHLTQQHKSITTLEGEDIVFLATDINLSGAVDWVMIQSCFSQNFMLVLEKQEKYHGHQQFFAVVQLIGTEKNADRFMYRLELNGGPKKRLIYEAAPTSIKEGVNTAINSSDCLVFDNVVAQMFSDNGNLPINVTIQSLM